MRISTSVKICGGIFLWKELLVILKKNSFIDASQTSKNTSYSSSKRECDLGSSLKITIKMF